MKKTCLFSALPDDRPVKAGHDVILVKRHGQVRALGARCPHAGAELEGGAVVGGRLICPWHKAAFDLDTGRVLEPPALNDIPTYQTRVEGGIVLLADRPSSPPPHTAPAPASSHSLLVLGSGAAAVAACAFLRNGGYGGSLALIGEEASDPYDRTSLSKFVLAGQMAPADAPALRRAEFWERANVRRVTRSISHVDAAKRRVLLEGGEEIAFDEAILALGARARRPSFPGATDPNVCLLRTRKDAAAIVAKAQRGAHAVLIGGSFIALEAASALRTGGVEVTVVSRSALPFVKQFGSRFGALFKSLHESNGVSFRAPARATSIENEDGAPVVVLETGERLAATFVLIGAGAQPATEMVEGVSKDRQGGIIVDSRMLAAPGLYAIGDCANIPWRGGAVRIEHWRTAQQQARIAAENVLGLAPSPIGTPFFWTYHYGMRFDYLGHGFEWDDLVVTGEPETFSFAALFVAKGYVQGLLACQREREVAFLSQRLASPLSIDEARGIF